MLGVIFVFLLAELNTFYLKFVLWLPPPHYLNLVRLLYFMFAGAVAMRETFQYMDDPECKLFGRQSWVIASIIITELLIVAKFGWETITKPLPFHVIVFWSVGLFIIAAWTIWNFFLKPYFWHPEDVDTSYETDADSPKPKGNNHWKTEIPKSNHRPFVLEPKKVN